MIPLAFICGLLIIGLGFATGSPEQPPMQAITFGGMFLIAAAFGRLWRVHGIGAATVVALLTTLSFGDALVVTFRRLAGGENLPASLIGQLSAALVAFIYFIIGARVLLKMMKRPPTDWSEK